MASVKKDTSVDVKEMARVVGGKNSWAGGPQPREVDAKDSVDQQAGNRVDRRKS